MLATGGYYLWIVDGPAGAARIRATSTRNRSVQSVVSFAIRQATSATRAK